VRIPALHYTLKLTGHRQSTSDATTLALSVQECLERLQLVISLPHIVRETEVQDERVTQANVVISKYREAMDAQACLRPCIHGQMPRCMRQLRWSWQGLVYVHSLASLLSESHQANFWSAVKIDQEGLVSGTQNSGIWAGDAILDTLIWTTTIPASLAPGNYLMRHELIAVHQANNPQCMARVPVCSGHIS
jgi:hypothetical protein